jgi:hypothetical protein
MLTNGLSAEGVSKQTHKGQNPITQADAKDVQKSVELNGLSTGQNHEFIQMK